MKHNRPVSPAPKPQVIVTQDNTLINHLKQLCQQQEQRVKELEKELRDSEQNLQKEKIEKENAENRFTPKEIQTADAMCSTDDLTPKPPPSFEQKNRIQSPASRSSRLGIGVLPPTPPSAGRYSRGRRSSASNRYVPNGALDKEYRKLPTSFPMLKPTKYCQINDL